jgi:hypothetical protein
MSEQVQVMLAHNVPGLGRTGQVVNLALTPADVSTPEEITTFVGGYSNAEYRADQASPIVPVDAEKGYYRTFNSTDMFKLAAVKGDGGKTNEIDPDSDVDEYKVLFRKVGSFIDRRLAKGKYDAELAATKLCLNVIGLSREHDVFRTLRGTNTNWDSSVRTAITGDDVWKDSGGDPGSTSNPIRDIQDAIEKSALSVNGLFMNPKVSHAFLRHSEVKDHMRQFLGDNSPAAATAKAAMTHAESTDYQIPGLPPIHVCAAKYVNDSDALEYVCPNCVILTHTPATIPDDGSDIASSYTFRFDGPGGTGFYVRKYEVPARGPYGGEMVVVTVADVEKMISNISGGIITGIIG